MIRYISSFFQRVTTGYQRATNALSMRYHTGNQVIIGNFDNIQHMSILCTILDVLLFTLLSTLKGIST